MNILITGGAGYIGSVLTYELIREGHNVEIFDNDIDNIYDMFAMSEVIENVANLQFGWSYLDIGNEKALNRVFNALEPIDIVIHLAADSTIDATPKSCYQNNVIAGVLLLNAMMRHDIKRMIFASSCSVYQPNIIPLKESLSLAPVSSYGTSKLAFEMMLPWYADYYGLKYIVFRYFNVAGANEVFGDKCDSRLVPNICRALLEEKPLDIYGTDYNTRDGTALRDYVHVLDVADAHKKAIDKIEELSGNVYNIGNGVNHTVLDVVRIASKVLDKKIPINRLPRRAGDSPYAMADIELIQRDLNWQPERGLESIIKSQYEWMTKQRIEELVEA